MTGPRLLTRPDDLVTKQALLRFAIEQAEKLNLSSVHCLFNLAEDHAAELQTGLLSRFDYQFHWHNQNYENFADFLSRLQSKKRKNIQQERRKVNDAGIEIKIYKGDELTEELWQVVYDFYRITFDKKSGHATLSLDFFQAIAKKLVVAARTVQRHLKNLQLKGKIKRIGAAKGGYWKIESENKK